MAQNKIEGSMKFPLLPLRDVTLFPQMVTGIEVGRPQSVAAVREAMQGDGYVACVMQRHMDTDNPGIDDLYTMGTIGKIKQILQLPDGVLRVLLEGVTRVHLLDIEATGAWQTACWKKAIRPCWKPIAAMWSSGSASGWNTPKSRWKTMRLHNLKH